MIDTSSSMVLDPGGNVSAGKLEAADAAAHRFIDDLNYGRDQIGLITYRATALLSTQLGTDAAGAKTALDAAVGTGIFCAGNLCFDQGSNVTTALDLALDELAGPRHRAGATPVLVYIGDGGNAPFADPTPQLTRLHSSGVHAVAIAIGS